MILVEIVKFIVHIDWLLHMLCHLKEERRKQTEDIVIHFITSEIKFNLFFDKPGQKNNHIGRAMIMIAANKIVN